MPGGKSRASGGKDFLWKKVSVRREVLGSNGGGGGGGEWKGPKDRISGARGSDYSYCVGSKPVPSLQTVRPQPGDTE